MWFDAISLGFDAGLRDIPPAAPGQVRALLPDLTKALEIGRVFALLKARYRAVLTALDHVQAGLAVVLPDGQVVVENAEAQRILRLGDGIALAADRRIVTADADVTAAIAASVGAAGQTARGRAARHETLLTIARPSGLAPFLLDIGPLSDSRAELEPGLDGALVTLIDPERIPYLRLDRFTALYGLTAAETDVCGWIAEGASVAEIAERRGTSPVTAKNQVASVLSKTGVGSRLALIRLILRVLPPVA